MLQNCLHLKRIQALLKFAKNTLTCVKRCVCKCPVFEMFEVMLQKKFSAVPQTNQDCKKHNGSFVVALWVPVSFNIRAKAI